MIKILILGKNSYIGKAIYQWLKLYPYKYHVSILSTRNCAWKQEDWHNIDTVIDCAGVAHIKNITEDMRGVFYSINRDLTVEMANYAKVCGVKQFILFSSMNVYGDYCGHIVDRNAVNPTSFYGDSKLQGDLEVKKLADENFKTAFIRPPFVYGKGCRGNYKTISELSKITPVFPEFINKKSMIYINNLCEYIRLLIENFNDGIYTPQNKELVSTSDLVREISRIYRHKIWFTDFFNKMIPVGRDLTRTVRRCFADDYYDMNLSSDFGYKYCIYSLSESIRLTEN